MTLTDENGIVFLASSHHLTNGTHTGFWTIYAKDNNKHSEKHPSQEARDTVYVRGWAYGLTWAEGLRIADKNKKLTGEGVKNALETLKNFDTGGLTPLVTYTATDHRPTPKSTIYVIKGGKMTKVEEVETPRRKEWLGL